MQFSQLDWQPTKYVAECCGDVIFSAYPGQYKECSCEGAFVDETAAYTRIGGKVKLYIENSENVLKFN